MNEYTERKEMPGDIVCMALGSIPDGEQRSRFLAVGLSDNTVRIISLDPQVKKDDVHDQRISTVSSACCLGLSQSIEYANTSCTSAIIVYCGNENNRRRCRGRYYQWS